MKAWCANNALQFTVSLEPLGEDQLSPRVVLAAPWSI